MSKCNRQAQSADHKQARQASTVNPFHTDETNRYHAFARIRNQIATGNSRPTRMVGGQLVSPLVLRLQRLGPYPG